MLNIRKKYCRWKHARQCKHLAQEYDSLCTRQAKLNYQEQDKDKIRQMIILQQEIDESWEIIRRSKNANK